MCAACSRRYRRALETLVEATGAAAVVEAASAARAEKGAKRGGET